MKTTTIRARKRRDNKVTLQLSKKQWEEIGSQMGWNKTEPGAIVFEEAPYVNLVIGVTDKAEILKDRPTYRFPVVDPSDETALSIEVEEPDEELFDKESQKAEKPEKLIRSLLCVRPVKGNP